MSYFVKRVVSTFHSVNIAMILLCVISLMVWRSNAVPAPIGGELNCPGHLLRTNSTDPSDVNFVRPADITFVVALGDSITSGFGSCDEPCSTVSNYMHNSFFTGSPSVGVEKQVTVANILLSVNKELKGQSTPYSSGMNVAVPGRRSDDLPRQAADLVNRLTMDSPQIVASGWKIMTIFMGTNDIIALCDYGVATSKSEFKKFHLEAISILQRMPRTIILIIPLWHVDFALRASNVVNKTVYNFCGKGMDKFAEVRTKEYNDAIDQIVKDPSLQGTDKAVMSLPLVDGLTGPLRKASGEYNIDFYSPDIFHISKYGNSLLAKQIWRLLLTPVQSRNTTELNLQDQSTELLCPPEDCPFIRTPGNSVNCRITP